MELRTQIINDIEILPEQALKTISVFIKEFNMSPAKYEAPPIRPSFGFGCMKGEIWMADDFDEPLEDFKEYML